METQIKVITSPKAFNIETNAAGSGNDDDKTDALRAYQVESMKLKDELMQLRVDAFDSNQKLASHR